MCMALHAVLSKQKEPMLIKMRRSKLHEVESAFAEFLFKEWENFHNKVLEYVG